MAINLKVNGVSHSVDVDPATPLLFVLADEIGDRGDIRQIQLRNAQAFQLRIGRDSDDMSVARLEQRLADARTMDLKLWVGLPLESFDQQKVDRAHARDQIA